jgi:hypothetical protein
MWPEDIGDSLKVEFVSLDDALNAVRSYNESLPPSHLRGKFASLTPSVEDPIMPPTAATKDSELENYKSLSEKVELSLDDIFKRTKKEPSLYYLPKRK